MMVKSWKYCQGSTKRSYIAKIIATNYHPCICPEHICNLIFNLELIGMVWSWIFTRLSLKLLQKITNFPIYHTHLSSISKMSLLINAGKLQVSSTSHFFTHQTEMISSVVGHHHILNQFHCSVILKLFVEMTTYELFLADVNHGYALPQIHEPPFFQPHF